MPFREQKLDLGFNTYLPEMTFTPPRARVTTLETIGAVITGDTATLERATKESWDTIRAGFEMESAPLAILDLMTRPTYQYDPTFDVESKLKADGLWNDYSDNFVGVRNEQEYLAIAGRIRKEQQNRRIIEASGVSGMVVMMAAGMLDPTSLLPFVTGLKGVKAVGAGIAAGTVSSAAQEVPLQMAQETRTMSESVAAVGMGAVVGGVLGGAVAFANKTPKAIGEELVRAQNVDMALARGSQAIPNPMPASIGAKAAEDSVPSLVRMSPLPKWVDPIHDAYILPVTSAIGNITLPNTKALGPFAGRSLGELTPGNIMEIFPTVYNFRSQSKQASRMTAKLEDSGLEIDGAVAGGTVANRVRTYDGPLAKALSEVEAAFARYRLGAQKASKLGGTTASKVVGLMSTDQFLSAKQFREQIGRAMRQGDQHEIPEVAEMARYLRSEIYDPLFKLAMEEGLFKDVPKELLGDISYINRVYNVDLITARKPEFIKLLQDHFNAKLSQEFREEASKLIVRQAKLVERVEDFARPYDEVVELRKKFEDDLKALDEGRDEELVELEDAISDKRSAARALDRGTPEREAALAEARALEQEGGEALAQVRDNRATIRRRLKNLRQAYSALSARQQAKLDKIALAEELSFNTLQRLVRKGRKVLADLDKLSDVELDRQIESLKGSFAQAAERYDNNEERIAHVFDDEFENDLPTSPFVQAAKVETETFDKMTDLANQIGDLETIDREALRDLILQVLDDATVRAQRIVERRAVRNARLSEQAADLDTDKALARVSELKEKMKQTTQDFIEDWRLRGADDIDPITGVADFKNYAREIATKTTDRILGTNMRLPGLDIILNPRDAELARTLDINSNALVSEADGRSFLIDDVQELVVRYNRTLAPDIELHRAYGDFAPDMEKNLEFQRLNEEYDAILERTQSEMKAGRNPKSGRKVSQPYTQEQIDKASFEIEKERKQVLRNLEAMIARVRHQWGLPKDPTGFGARAGKLVSNINVLRFMSNVVISSYGDVARPIQKHGLLRTFRDGYIPFLKGLSSGKLLREGMTERHLRATGAALDVVLHSRSGQLFDVGDYIVRGGKFEKAVEWGTGKIGIVAAFDYWTSAMKQIAGAVSNARLMDSLSVVAGGEKANAKELEEAVRYLASGGIDDELARRIWQQVSKPGGADKVNGQWWANTDEWAHEERMAYNSFLYRDVSNQIITPSVDAPLFTDANPFLRLLFQFKSFGMSSTTRTLMAGLQQRDMAFVTGSTISLALGALSYYTYANIVGGRVLAEMQDNLEKGNWEKFADEAINRSGLLGFGADLQSIGAAVPGIADKVTFSGQRSTRQGGANLLETIAGPTFGDFANTTANVATGLYSPTQGTVHQVRTLMPLQNHALLRHIYDKIEGAAGGLPERRK